MKKNPTGMNSYQKHHAEQIRKILAALPKNASDTLKRFVHQFYAKMPAFDLEAFPPKHAVALAASAWQFAQKRKPGEPKIRVFSPRKAEDGYESKYIVVEVLGDDMPFLVDSLSAELTRLGFTIRETLHPILKVKRDDSGVLKDVADNADLAESLIHFEISALPEGLPAKQLIADMEWALAHIRAAVEDWQPITYKVKDSLQHLSRIKKQFDPAEVAEVEDFLHWLIDRNFVFLGYAEYDFFDLQGREKLTMVPGSALGILKLDDTAPRGLEALPPELRRFLLVPQLIEITKSNRRSPVHRPVPMDYIGLKRFDAKGKVIGEARFLGLFTSNVYYQSADHIPLLRQKINKVLERTDFNPTSHDGKALKAILEFLPRDEVFQMSDDDLFETAMGILSLEAKPGVRMFVRRDAFERFISAMVFVPRERFSTELRRQIQHIVEKAWNATSSTFSTQITEAPLARLHLIVKTTPGEIPEVDIAKVEKQIARSAYLWGDLLYEELLAHYGEQKAEKLQRIYGNAFTQNYINRHGSTAAVYDISKIEDAIARGELVLDLFHDKNDDAGFLHLKIYNVLEEIALSDILPLLESAGFRVIEEHPYSVTPQEMARVRIRDFKLAVAQGTMPRLEKIKQPLEEVLLKTWRREAENDRFNALVLNAGLNWRQAVLLRAYARYLKQIGFAYPQVSIEQAMNQQPEIACNIVRLFECRFDPTRKDREAKQHTLQEAIEKQLAEVSNVIEDRIMRRYVELILATMRTNYFQRGADGALKPVLSFKFDGQKVPDLPLPKPYAEIFVYGARVEGTHLRGGKVARGGLRWSDRPDDFRTEVLGLMKAQMVKNSVIVPVGSKGGFVLKQPPLGGREALQQEGIACYTMYLQGLLDLTDNIIKGKIVPPAQMVRHDDDDPYLVVAADKGTATFSDIANGVSQAYGFWLGDAFASGGSAGYDHKAMGITARGGWVSVSRHFSETGIDITKQEFTACGIGDMSGDVFGNGMLLSDRIRLIAAFNHLHIFIDPNPDAKKSFAERRRLFHLSRSSWRDYDTALLSKGGGVYDRSAKSIALSKEAQVALGVSKGSLTPDEVVRAILLAPVDLLWNGGIGTYVKAEDETHEQVGDRTNNSVRVNGNQLRCKVVGEGGNLGFTQKGRIEYAKTGGRINTDAIDNSAGVDCSDHEVNIKIAFSQAIASGELTLKERDKLLAAMTDEVARLVLKDNVLQTQAITVAQLQGVHLLESQARLMQALERQGMLNRAIEFLPGEKQIAELKLARRGLTRPELAVLLAYSKMAMYRDILASTLPDEPYFLNDLKRYFPKAMRERFANAIERHPLKREIVATMTTNSLVNRAGITFYFDIAEDLGASARDIAAAYALARDVFGLRALWKEIETADVGAEIKVEMYALVSDFLGRVTVWLLRNLPLPLEIDRIAQETAPGIGAITQHQQQLHSETTQRAAEKLFARLSGQGVPPSLAGKIANLELMSSAFDVIAVAHKTGLPVELVGKVYFAIGARARLGWLRLMAARTPISSHWERQAVQSLIGDFYDEQRRLTATVIEKLCKDKVCDDSVEQWVVNNAGTLQRFERFIDGLKASDVLDIPKLMVALQHVRSL